MTGVAALAISAAFTSCSSNEELYNPEQITANESAQIIENYNRAFEATFGQPAANQDWGFGSGTRAGGNFAEYSGAEPNGHLWTSYGFQAPDALTAGQKLRVQYYFQTNKITNPYQPDNGVKDFFMQQVYDGGTDPVTKYKDGDYSAEVYYDAVDNRIESGEQMNYLKAGSDHAHVNNYNNGNYPDPITNVANWNQTVQDDHSQEHEDQIMLMLNTKTDCFGYLNSSNNTYYDDQWTLVSCQTIDNYCDNVDAAGYAAFLAAHSGVEDKAVTDKWNRGFIGFDFKLLPDPNPLTDKTALYSDAASSDWHLEFNGTSFVEYTNTSAEIKINNNAISVLENNLNFYGANLIGVGNQDNHNEYPLEAAYVEGGENNGSLYITNIPGEQSDHRALNLKFIERMVNAGYLPVDTKNLRLWAKVSDLTDGYYSDWIVSFMPADYNPPTPSEWDIRVIAEDLNAQAADSEATDDWSVGSDWDFNDVVFDVKFTSNTTANVKIIGAGGVYPLYVAGHEAHQALGQTAPDSNGRYKIQNSGNADVFEVTGINKANNARDIVITVVRTSSSGQDIISELKAEVGKPAAKIGVKPKFEPCAERQDIRQKYPLFSDWVQGNITGAWYTVKD